ncbi:hypothetical protein NECAME_10264 [Necator americanus]|uniref:Uncharacterized protein n=1 Tax=Necator americanus TaxID=51031 RepID=W2T9M2_NECAM|nr:hypothetical protein NECAME_10264 [Necator americanus]ETN78568.1 hypothetical protein NECAME_10264 [Necator americanus]
MHLLLKVRSAYQHVVIIFGNDVRVENIGADAQALEAEEPDMPSEGSGEEHLRRSITIRGVVKRRRPELWRPS